MNNKIIRKVNGDFRDPASTRELSHATAEEIGHIRMCCEAGMLEAETYLAMGDVELRVVLERNMKVISGAGLCQPSQAPEVNSELREYMRTRFRACASILRKVNKHRDGTVTEITPTEYEHLVISIQAGYREAEVCCAFNNKGIAEAFASAISIRERLGLAFENPYADHCGDYLEFFLERSEILWDVLRRVNQPYEAVESADETVYAICS